MAKSHRTKNYLKNADYVYNKMENEMSSLLCKSLVKTLLNSRILIDSHKHLNLNRLFLNIFIKKSIELEKHLLFFMLGILMW